MHIPIKKSFLTLMHRWWYPCTLLIAAAICLLHAMVRYFDIDECEAVSTSWKIFQGQEIYVDFFQHHHPFFYHLLMPIFWFTGPSTNALLIARSITISCAIGVVLLAYLIAKRTFDPWVAKCTVLFCLSSVMFATRLIEVRPDVPQLFMCMLACYALLVFFDTQCKRWLIISALSLSCGFLLLQKALFFGIGLAVIMLHAWHQKTISLKDILYYLCIGLIPVTLYGTYLTWHGQCELYVKFNWLLNMHIDHRWPVATLRHTLRSNGPLWFFYLYALACIPMRTDKQRYIWWLSVWFLLCLLLAKRPDPQYMLPAFPFVCMLAAHSFVRLIPRKTQWVAMLIIIMFPLSALVRGAQKTWRPQLQRINYVLAHTSEHDTLLDMLNRFNIFRNDIDYFWFSHLCRPIGQQLLKCNKQTIYELIEQRKPTFIGIESVDDINHPTIKAHYGPSRYDDMVIRTDVR